MANQPPQRADPPCTRGSARPTRPEPPAHAHPPARHRRGPRDHQRRRRAPSACAPPAARLGVVPGALYRHVRSKEQLYDLVLDDVLAEVDCQADHSLDWAGQVTALAQRLRAVLENHPGIAALLKTRDPLSPHSLALTEAFLAPLHAAGLPERQAVLAFRLIYDYTLGFALSDRTSASEQRLQDTATRHQLHTFLRSLPTDRFPVLATHGEHIWLDDRDERFTASLHTLISGLQAAQPGRRHPRH